MARDEITHWLVQARKFQSKGDLGSAEKLLNQLVRSAPLLPEVHHRLAKIYIATARTPQAKASLDRALTQAPNSPAIWATTIQLARNLADQPSLARLEAGLKLAPLEKFERRKLQKLLKAPLRPSALPEPTLTTLKATGALTEALTLAESHCAKAPTPARCLALAQCQRDLHRDEAALATLEDGCAMFPDHLPLAELRITHLRNIGRRLDARDAIEKARTRWPDEASLILFQASSQNPPMGLSTEIDARLSDANLPPASRRRLLFAQAKLLEGSGQDFPSLVAANTLTRAAHPYDSAPDELDVLANQAGFKALPLTIESRGIPRGLIL